MAKKKDVLLTKLELALARIVWASHPQSLTVREIVDRYNAESTKPLAYNTVQTMMTILKEKGVVTSKAGPGRAHLFKARLTQRQVSHNMVSDLVDRLFDGQSHALLLQLIENENLTRTELESLRGWIEEKLSDQPEEER